MDSFYVSEWAFERPKENHMATYGMWWQLLKRIDTNDSEDGTTAKQEIYPLDVSQKVLDFDSTVWAGTCNRTFFISEKGHMGLGPSNAASGDKIAVLFGGKVPYILRKNEYEGSENPEITWKFLGDSYVHGIMDGEVIESLGKGEVMEELITLK
jgi:hypothetical protein